MSNKKGDIMSIITKIRRLFNPTFMDWDTYNNQIRTLDNIRWVQAVRKRNIQNSPPIGKGL